MRSRLAVPPSKAVPPTTKFVLTSEPVEPGREREAHQPVTDKALSHALRRICKERGRTIKPHGNRAFYVTVRRSWGVPDNQIAYEIGHSSGGSTLESVYGGVPPHWRKGEGPKMMASDECKACLECAGVG